MKPSELFEALHALITERVPLHIWVACGVGKSQIVGQVASDLGSQFLDLPLHWEESSAITPSRLACNISIACQPRCACWQSETQRETVASPIHRSSFAFGVEHAEVLQ